ncbi:MAG TPA: efflux RND transporter periplasmic adaptor subunit [Candidatus Aquirickettsiella sp.]|jgi:membrane fusion protein (multidrug efflux system)
MLKRLISYIFLFGLIAVSTICLILDSKKNTALSPPTLVEATQARSISWQNTLEAIGSLSASQGVVIKAETTGRISAIYFRSGDNVKMGDPLVQLNPAILKAQLDAAQAETQLSKADYTRGLTLFKKKVFAKADLDKVAASYHANLGKQAQIAAALDQMLIRAPFSGQLGLRMVNLGDIIDPNKPIVNLEAINPLRVDFNIPGTAANKITLGSKVFIHSSAYPDKTFVGTIYAVDSYIDNDTRSLSVRASLNNPKKELLPGAFVDININLGPPENLIIVPETAVNSDQNGNYVYRIIKQRAIKTPVIIRFHQNGEIGLSSGIHAGDQIISVGGFKVQANSVVIVKR